MFFVCDAFNTKYAFLEKTVKAKTKKKTHYGVNRVQEIIETKFSEQWFQADTQSKEKKINPL